MKEQTVGFTGTRRGMTAIQKEQVTKLVISLRESGYSIARHGMCVGADEDFHNIVRELEFYVIGHPGVNSRGACPSRGRTKPDLILEALPFIERNHIISDFSSVMIATPKALYEEFRGSGTWATIRYTKRQHRKLFIVYPTGMIEESA